MAEHEKQKEDDVVKAFLSRLSALPDRDLNDPEVWADIQDELSAAIQPEIEKEERIRTALMGGSGLLKTIG